MAKVDSGDNAERKDRKASRGEEPPLGSRPPGSLGRQFVGALVGAAVALLLALAGQQLGWLGGDLMQYVLWGGVIGGLVGGSDALAQAGKRLTRRDEDWLNILVAIVGMTLVFSAVYALARLLSRLVGTVLRTN